MIVSQIGFIGAGRMGGAVARRLARGGYAVHVYDLNEQAITACVEAGAVAAASAVDAATGADVVFTSLPMPEHVQRCWSELAPHLKDGAIAVDLSTIDPATAEVVGQTLNDTETPFVSCTLGKTPAAAEQGEIPLFMGGPAHAITSLQPLWECIGEKVYDFGSPTAATMFKLISNLIGMTNLAVLAEGYVLGRRAGIEPSVFAEALADTGARSFQSDVRLPWIMKDDFEARFAAALAGKDVRLAVAAAATWGIPTPVAAQALSQLLSTLAHGYGHEDATAITKVLDPHGAIRRGEAAGQQ